MGHIHLKNSIYACHSKEYFHQSINPGPPYAFFGHPRQIFCLVEKTVSISSGSVAGLQQLIGHSHLQIEPLTDFKECKKM